MFWNQRSENSTTGVLEGQTAFGWRLPWGRSSLLLRRASLLGFVELSDGSLGPSTPEQKGKESVWGSFRGKALGRVLRVGVRGAEGGSVVVGFRIFGAPRSSVQRSQNTYFEVFWDLALWKVVMDHDCLSIWCLLNITSLVSMGHVCEKSRVPEADQSKSKAGARRRSRLMTHSLNQTTLGDKDLNNSSSPRVPKLRSLLPTPLLSGPHAT